MNKIDLIAETAWHHDGEFSFMEHLVDTILHKSKADILKMHLTLDFDEYMDLSHPLYHELKSKMFTENEWTLLLNNVKSSDLALMLLYNDTKAVEFGTQFDPDLVEIHAVCLNDIFLLDALKENIKLETKVVFGIGGSTLEEIEFAINRIQHENIVLMYGFQNYPTKYENINLLKFEKFKSKYPEYEFGYADHSAWDEPNNQLITLLGSVYGVSFIEKHVTSNYGSKRTDFESAISIDMLNSLSEKLELVSKCNGSGTMELNLAEKEYCQIGLMKKAGILSRDVKAGDKHSTADIEFKRVKDNTDLSLVDLIRKTGNVYTKDLSKGSLLISSDLKGLS